MSDIDPAFLVAQAIGVRSGHVLAFCSECHEPTMTVNRSSGDETKWPKCRMTPDCPGRHMPLRDGVA